MPATIMPAMIGSICRRAWAPTPLAVEACWITACAIMGEPNSPASMSAPACGCAIPGWASPNRRPNPMGSVPALRWIPMVKAGSKASMARRVCSGVRPNCCPKACTLASPWL